MQVDRRYTPGLHALLMSSIEYTSVTIQMHAYGLDEEKLHYDLHNIYAHGI